MQRASYDTVKTYLQGLEPQSGDAMLTKAFWNVLGIGPTDPGRLTELIDHLRGLGPSQHQGGSWLLMMITNYS